MVSPPTAVTSFCLLALRVWAVPPSVEGTDRGLDVLSYDISFDIDPAIRFLSGTTVIRVAGFAPSTTSLALDLDDAFSVSSVNRDGQGVTRDMVRALTLFLRACEGSAAIGCYQAAYVQYTGDGLPRDLAAAARFFERACDGDFAAGCTTVARMFQRGTGVTADAARATALFARGCRLGDASACAPATPAAAH